MLDGGSYLKKVVIDYLGNKNYFNYFNDIFLKKKKKKVNFFLKKMKRIENQKNNKKNT